MAMCKVAYGGGGGSKIANICLTPVNKHSCNAIRVAMQSHADSIVKYARNFIALQDVLHCNYVCTSLLYNINM